MRLQTCDVCGKPSRIVAKLFFTPMDGDGPKKSPHTRYRKHADVGECCSGRVLQVIKFRDRMTKAEYDESRRKRVA
jgi:hypothetical protein